MTHDTDAERALSSLRHLYRQMAGGMVKDSAQAKRIAEGLLSPAIARLEQAARRAPAAPVPQGWKPVPEAITDAMLIALIEGAFCRVTNESAKDFRRAWAAALAAAPQPPEAAPVVLPEYGIDTASHAGIRVRGFTEQQVRELLAAQASVSNGTLPSQPTFKTEDGEKARKPLTDEQIEAAAKCIAESLDYPWSGMVEGGRESMRSIAKAAIERAHGIGKDKA